MKNHSIIVSAPGKIHLLGEHFVVYGKPALLTTVDLRVTVTLQPASVILNPKGEGSSTSLNKTALEDSSPAEPDQNDNLKKIIEPIVKKHLKIKTIPPYRLSISSQIPIGAGLGSSAAVSAAYIAALLSFLEVKWDLNLINQLTFEAEKVFHSNPSGGDNSTVVFGRLVWFRKESPDLKLIQQVPFTTPKKLAKNFVLINTGRPKETTRQMVEIVAARYKIQETKIKKIFDHQEQLVRELLPTIQSGNENQLIAIIRAGEKNLESIGVVSKSSQKIIRDIEKIGGAAKICGAGGKVGPTGIILAYHTDKAELEKIAVAENLPYFSTNLGVEGIKQEL